MFWCGAFGGSRCLSGDSEEQFVDAHALGIARLRLERQQHQQRHDDGAAQ